VKLAAELFNQVGRGTAEFGVRVCLRPVFGTLLETRGEIGKLLRRTSARDVRISLDAEHFGELGLVPANFLKRRKARVGCIHLRDVPAVRGVASAAPARATKKTKRKTSKKPTRAKSPRSRSRARGGPPPGPVEILFRAAEAVRYEGWVVVDRSGGALSQPSEAAPGQAIRERARRDREPLRHLLETF